MNAESTERLTPTPVIKPRCTAYRDPATSAIEIHFHGDGGKVSAHILTSRAAQELFDELVRELAKEGRAS